MQHGPTNRDAILSDELDALAGLELSTNVCGITGTT
jgi:hypothetical protein